MKALLLLAAVVFAINLPTQTRPPGSVSTPQYLVVDSRDNVFVTLKYGMLKIAPDGTVTAREICLLLIWPTTASANYRQMEW